MRGVWRGGGPSLGVELEVTHATGLELGGWAHRRTGFDAQPRPVTKHGPVYVI